MTEHKNTEFTDDPIPVNQILEAAKDCIPVAIIIGLDKEGNVYFASSTGDKTTIKSIMAKANAYAERHVY